jgi:hypothetical protein
MGRKAQLEISPPEAWWEGTTVVAGLSAGEAALLCALLAMLLYVRISGRQAMKDALGAKNATRALDISALARVTLVKEVFMAYLGAAILEPLLAIANTDSNATGKELFVTVMELLSLIFWFYMLTDAFDTSDTAASFVYNKKLTVKHAFLKRVPRNKLDERNTLAGSMSRDVALWFCILGIFAACAGVVSHRDVVHSWAVVLLWTILHHNARLATSWGAGYFTTLLMPSAALLPLEYCLPLMGDLDIVGDDEGMADWHAFVKAQTGINLLIIYDGVGQEAIKPPTSPRPAAPKPPAAAAQVSSPLSK